MGNVFRSLRQDLTLQSLKREVRGSRALNQSQKTLAQTRIEFVESFVADASGVSELVRPGRLLLVDVRDPWLEHENALALFMVMLRLCAQARTPDGRSFNKLIVFDEAHKYMGSSNLTGAIVESVREMRHKGTTVVIASQDPPSLPREVLELSSVVFAHRFTSPKWLQHVAHVNEAFARGLTPAQLATLKPGEAFVWSLGGARQFRSPQRVRMRPRLTRHGGGTRRAAGDS
jgi:DNA phosphorothioation-dependent restriction protein DptH